MKRPAYFWISATLLLTGLILISGCDKRTIFDAGYLEGSVSIGPICPVETDPPDPGCLPSEETYKAYPLSVWTSGGKIKIAQIRPVLDGTFSLMLPAGNYIVILEKKQGGIGSSNLPAEVSISAQEITVLNIDIDTGIR